MPHRNANSGNQGGNDPSGSTPGAGDEFTPITTQEDLNRIIGDRVSRERAKYADYDDLKGKAARVEELEQAATDATESVPGLVTSQLKDHLVELHQIDTAKADALLTATEPDALLMQLKHLLPSGDEPPKRGNRAPNVGTQPTRNSGGDQDEREAARTLFATD